MRLGADLPPLPGIPASFRWIEVLQADYPTRTVTAAYTAQAHDYTIRADATAAAFSVTLPPAALLSGKVLTIKKVDASANAVTVDGNGAEEIDGAATFSLAAQYDAVTVQSFGTGWDVLATV